MKNRYKKNKGFTLVDLIVGIVVACVLAINAGAILYYGFVSWHRDRDAVELQRSATLAMNMLSRAIRPVRISQIATTGPTLTIGNRDFYQSGNSLWYDPDTGASGDEVEVIKDNVSNISFGIDTLSEHISINMVLQDGSVFDYTIGCRI